MAEFGWFRHLVKSIFRPDSDRENADRYRLLRRNIVLLMMTVTIVPLTLMAFINYHQYRTSITAEIVSPMRVLSSKTKHSFELFLEEKLSNVRFIASAYPLKDLTDQEELNRVVRVLKIEVGGFVGHKFLSPYRVSLDLDRSELRMSKAGN